MNMTAIFIVGIVCWSIVELVNGGKKKKQSKEDTQDINELKSQIAQLQDRIVTLEKIVTDDKESLKREINSL